MTITIESAAASWLRNLRTRKRRPAKPATIRTFGNYVRGHIIPRIGNRQVGEVGVAVMRDFVAQLDGTGLSAKTVNEIVSATKSIIASVCNDEGEQLYPRKWDNEKIDLPIVSPAEQNTPIVTREQIESAIRHSDDVYRCLYALLAGSGLRIGEALAVKVIDDGGTFFDAAAGTIRVRRSVYDGQEQSPKTPAAIRDVEIPTKLVDMMARFAAGREGYLFGSGLPMDESTARKRMNKVLPATGFHAFRRFRVTTLRGAQVPDEIAMYWTGHSRHGTMTGHYSKFALDAEARRKWCERCGLGFSLPGGK